MNVLRLFRASAAFWLALGIVSSASAVAAQQPNILFILADDMGWQDTSVPFGPERTKGNDRYRHPRRPEIGWFLYEELDPLDG